MTAIASRSSAKAKRPPRRSDGAIWFCADGFAQRRGRKPANGKRGASPV